MRKICIQIVTYNSAPTIQTALQSVLGQTYQDYDLTIVDNASNDDTVAIIRALNLDVICNAQNSGYAAAHNQALEISDAPYVLTLNPDVWLAPNFIETMLATLDSYPRVGAAAGCLQRVEHLDDQPIHIDSTGLYMMPSRRQRLRDEGKPIEDHTQIPTYIFGPDGAAAVYRRAMLDDIKIAGEFFDTDFFMHKEDVDICWRAQWRGWDALYVPAATAKHIRHFRPGQRQQVSEDMRFLSVRNRYLLMFKNDAAGHFWRDFFHIALYDLKIFFYILLFERASLRALYAVWKLRHRTKAKRQHIQQTRVRHWRDLRQWFKEY